MVITLDHFTILDDTIFKLHREKIVKFWIFIQLDIETIFGPWLEVVWQVLIFIIELWY